MSFTPPPNLLATLGAYAGIRRVQLRGRNAAISNSAETIWAAGGTYAQLSTAAALEAVSSSANDASAGTGARTITVELIDGNYAKSTVTVTLNGTTPVAITGTFISVNSVRVATAGSGGTNAGTIDIRTVSGSTVKSSISTGATLGLGQAADFIYTVPASTYGVLSSIDFSATGVTGDLTVYLNTIDSSGITRNEGAGKSSLYVTAFNGARGKIFFGNGLVISPRTTIELRAIVSAGAGDLVAMAELLLITQGVNQFVPAP